MTSLDVTLETIVNAREALCGALDALEARGDFREDAEMLRGTVGDLAALINKWERERNRWL